MPAPCGNPNEPREVEPFVGYIASLLFGVLALLVSFWLDARLNLPVHGDLPARSCRWRSPLMIAGLFLIVSRRTAMTQVLGYLVLENGIYTFGLAIVAGDSGPDRAGRAAGRFRAVFVMGIAMYHINREFDHIDSDQLDDAERLSHDG